MVNRPSMVSAPSRVYGLAGYRCKAKKQQISLSLQSMMSAMKEKDKVLRMSVMKTKKPAIKECEGILVSLV